MPAEFDNKSVLSEGVLEIAKDAKMRGIYVAVWHQPLYSQRDDSDFNLSLHPELQEIADVAVIASDLVPFELETLLEQNTTDGMTLRRIYLNQPVDLLFARQKNQRCVLLIDESNKSIAIPNSTSLIKGNMQRLLTVVPVTDAFIRREFNQSTIFSKYVGEFREKTYKTQLESSRKGYKEELQRTHDQVMQFSSSF